MGPGGPTLGIETRLKMPFGGDFREPQGTPANETGPERPPDWSTSQIESALPALP